MLLLFLIGSVGGKNKQNTKKQNKTKPQNFLSHVGGVKKKKTTTTQKQNKTLCFPYVLLLFYILDIYLITYFP